MPRPTPAPPPPPAARDVDVERDALTAMRKDGTLDALRARAVERVRADPEMKTFTEFAARASQTLRDPRARRASRKDLVDALFRECSGPEGVGGADGYARRTRRRSRRLRTRVARDR